MRAHTLLALSAVALTIPANAVPLGTTTVITAKGMTTMTMIANTPPEVQNPVPTDKHENARVLKTMARPPSLPGLRRGVGFRQADYGVNPNVTFGEALRPVAGVEASPTAAATPAAHSRRWKSYSQYGADDLNAADHSPNDLAKVDVSPSPAAAAPTPSGLTGEVPDTNSNGSSSSTSGSGSGSDPVRVGQLSDTNANHIPVYPNLSGESRLAAQSLKSGTMTRYQASDGIHQVLEKVGGNAPNSTAKMPTAADVEKTHSKFEKEDYKLDHSVHRRVLAPASYLSTSEPVRRMKQFARDLVQFVARHSLEFNTASVLPSSHPDPSMNMSDPDVVREQARQKNIGLINIDSNQAPQKHKPKIAAPAQLNTTQKQVDTTTGNATKAA